MCDKTLMVLRRFYYVMHKKNERLTVKELPQIKFRFLQ